MVLFGDFASSCEIRESLGLETVPSRGDLAINGILKMSIRFCRMQANKWPKAVRYLRRVLLRTTLQVSMKLLHRLGAYLHHLRIGERENRRDLLHCQLFYEPEGDNQHCRESDLLEAAETLRGS